MGWGAPCGTPAAGLPERQASPPIMFGRRAPWGPPTIAQGTNRTMWEGTIPTERGSAWAGSLVLGGAWKLPKEFGGYLKVETCSCATDQVCRACESLKKDHFLCRSLLKFGDVKAACYFVMFGGEICLLKYCDHSVLRSGLVACCQFSGGRDT
ncbi:hypothetical protein L7F22_028916 [Adiantum nelumboides]|nr:hypothetical protein [Adiantum nelumboides]